MLSEPMVELIEPSGAHAAEVLVSFWSTQEDVLEEIGGEPETGGVPEEVTPGAKWNRRSKKWMK